jgi:hypothetical protein
MPLSKAHPNDVCLLFSGFPRSPGIWRKTRMAKFSVRNFLHYDRASIRNSKDKSNDVHNLILSPRKEFGNNCPGYPPLRNVDQGNDL